ncbi:hypothetical protein IFR04_007734 [Cadophora malorum]|uniref:Uncharacterized protein n=1 Tax=Cadophora malorum TaxID=108018 RepID=A0A8H7THZ0_9HELO|nr:hypothetical protein IFR04_007734 [Cadophora malorum]
MLLHSLLTNLLLAIAVSASAFPAAITPTTSKICKKPYCTSLCADGTPFNCCVTYVRDPCSDHQIPKYPPLEKCTGADDFDCKCRCEKYPEIEYFCNARYFRDPCSPLDDEEVGIEGIEGTGVE